MTMWQDAAQGRSSSRVMCPARRAGEAMPLSLVAAAVAAEGQSTAAITIAKRHQISGSLQRSMRRCRRPMPSTSSALGSGLMLQVKRQRVEVVFRLRVGVPPLGRVSA